MLYVYYGTDTISVRTKALASLHAADSEKSIVVRQIDVENYEPHLFGNLVGAVSLFGVEEHYLIDTPSQSSEMYEAVLEHLEVFAVSSHLFVIVEQGLVASEKKKFSKHATTIEECKGMPATRFNVFAMADALANRDKKALWILYTEAKRANITAEEIIGTLWWQLKTLKLASCTRSASEAGMKDYPYQKAQRALKHFPETELVDTMLSLVRVYHEGHSGEYDIDLALEHWILTR